MTIPFGFRHTGVVPPSIPSGYIIPPSFSVVVPEGRTNLVANPSGERDTYGWTDWGGVASSRTSLYSYVGGYGIYSSLSTDIAFGKTIDDTPILTTIEDQIYTISVYIIFPVEGIQFKLKITTDSDELLAEKTFTSTGRWQRVSMIYTDTVPLGESKLIIISLVDTVNPKSFDDLPTAYFVVDGLQVEAGGYLTTYIDGDQVGLVPNEFPRPYYWQGIPHRSASTRSSLTRSGGKVVNLSDYGFSLMGISGLGVSPIQNILIPYAFIDGSQYERSRKPEREFSLIGRFEGITTRDLQQKQGALEKVLSRDYSAYDQPLKLLYSPLSECWSEIGLTGELICLYSGGLEGSSIDLNAEAVTLSFVMDSPNILSQKEFGTSITTYQDVTNANAVLYRSPGGVWSALGTAAPAGPPAPEIFCITEDPTTGYILVGGNFINMGGNANSDYFAQWDPILQLWRSSGVEEVFNGVVRTIAVDSNGTIYVGGDFTQIGGDTHNRVAYSTDHGETWDNIDAAGGANDSVYCLVITPWDGYLYAGGSFTTMSGGAVASAYFAKITGPGGTWEIGAPLSTKPNGLVRTIEIHSPSLLYLGGDFTLLGATTVNFIGKYIVGSAFSSSSTLGTGCNDIVRSIRKGSDGNIYVGGDFTAVNGITAYSSAMWNGVKWFPLVRNSGGPSVYTISLHPDGSLIWGGDLVVADDVDFLLDPTFTLTRSYLGRLIGSTWLPLDVMVPTTTSYITTSYITQSGGLYIGFSGRGTSRTSLVTSVTYNGSSRGYPRITVSHDQADPIALYEITNITTGKSIHFQRLFLRQNEVVEINFSLRGLTFKSSYRGDISTYILPGSTETEMILIPGENDISIISSDALTFLLFWKESHETLKTLVGES